MATHNTFLTEMSNDGRRHASQHPLLIRDAVRLAPELHICQYIVEALFTR